MSMNNALVKQLASQLDEDAVQDAVVEIIEDRAKPHLDDIRERAADAEGQAEVREVFESLPDEKKNEVFHETWAELIVTVAKLRLRPIEGFTSLKRMIRDPYTLEALLLMVEQEGVPDDEERKRKEFIAEQVHTLGVVSMPEAYPEQDVRDVIETFGVDPDLLDKVPDPGEADDPDQFVEAVEDDD